MTDVAAVVDLGGDDEYIEGSVSLERPVLVILDLGGSNYFHGTRPGIQGGAVLGVSMLLDLGGNNVYEAHDVAQGSAICGVGIIDRLLPAATAIGASAACREPAICGLGILINRSGNNDYRAAMWGQGFGGPLGWGMLDDVGGHNHFFLGGLWRDSYPETPGYEGWGQGLGAGIRQVADGGLGILLDGGRRQRLRVRLPRPRRRLLVRHGLRPRLRRQQQMPRFHRNRLRRRHARRSRSSNASAAASAATTPWASCSTTAATATIAARSWAWASAGIARWACSAISAATTKYDENSMTCQGCGAQASLGILFDYGGDSNFVGYGQGFANPAISYHSLPNCGGNFSFLVHYGGDCHLWLRGPEQFL